MGGAATTRALSPPADGDGMRPRHLWQCL